MARPRVRSGMPGVALSREEFTRRFLARFEDPAFGAVEAELARVVEVAWQGYREYRKSPRTRKAGPGFADPAFDLPVEWLEARAQIHAAERRQKRKSSPTRILLVNGSPRTNQSCPGEM